MGTSNIELISMSKYLDIPNFYCLMKDQLKSINDIKYPLNIVVNLQNSNENGSHWSLIYGDDKQKIYYSSYGDDIPNECKEFLMNIDDRSILTSNWQIQDFKEDTCGLYSIIILYFLNLGDQFEDIVLSLIND